MLKNDWIKYKNDRYNYIQNIDIILNKSIYAQDIINLFLYQFLDNDDQIYFLGLKVKINEYHKVFIIDSDTIKNFIEKFEFLIIEKIILN